MAQAAGGLAPELRQLCDHAGMDIGLFAPIASANAGSDFVRTLGREAEARGFSSIWVPEHVVLFDEDDYESDYPYDPSGTFPGGEDTGLLEPFTALTYLAAVTDRIRLGTSICLIPQRNPVYTAKVVADLDVLSGGRVDFGVGVGWLREEFDVLNVPFARRGQRADEYLQIMALLWSDGKASFEGETYTLPPVTLHPKPVQRPHPPVHVGGESDAALRRVARFGQGWFTFNRPPAEMGEALERLDAALAAEGRRRSDDDFRLTVCPYLHPVQPADLGAYADAGVDELVVTCLAFSTDDLGPALDGLVAQFLEV